MCGPDDHSDVAFCYTSLEGFVPKDLPLRPIPTIFSQIQARLRQAEVAKKFFDRVLAQARSAQMLSEGTGWAETGP